MKMVSIASMLVCMLLALSAAPFVAARNPPIHFTKFAVRAKSDIGDGAKIVVKVGVNNNVNQATTLQELVLTKTMKTYRFEIPTRSFNSFGDLFVQYVNDNNDRNAIVDYIKINGEARQAEQYLNIGAFTSGSGCGTGLSQEISCPGYINFGGVYLTPKTIKLRAKGLSNSEIVEVKVGGTTVGRVKLSKSYETYTMMTTLSQGDITAQFMNDANQYTTVVVNYVDIDGEQRKASEQSKNTGAYDAAKGTCATVQNDPTIACNGAINFGKI